MLVKLLLLAALLMIAVLAAASSPDASYSRRPGVKTRLDVKIPMRDGVKLSADIYLPDGPGPFPVVLVRTPYDNMPLAEKGLIFASNGYVYVAQDCRGRYDSEGSFYAWHQEVNDGLDTRRWIARQPWCNGKIGTVGGSYLGMVQWLGVIESTEHLTAMMPSVTPIDGWIWGNEYVNGAYQLALNHGWGFSTTGRTKQPTDQYDWGKLLMFLPLVEMDRVATGQENPFIRDWIKHPAYDEYWRRISMVDRFSQINVPVYNIAGWFDAYPAAAFRAFTGVREHAGDEQIRKSQRILVGPWPHGISRSSRTGELDFGPQALLDTVENLTGHNAPLDLSLRWFDYWLKGIDNGIMREPPIRIFVMGANVWRNENEWPLARTRFTKYYLHSRGKANSLEPDDGRIHTTPPGEKQPPDRYTYNPDNPVWERGGNFSYSVPGIGVANDLAGPFDQRPTERRDDVLVYTSEELKEDLEVTGPLTTQLYISSSAPDTDFAVRLVDVYPDGRALNFSEGIVRARYRNSKESPSLLEPGQIYPLTVEMQPTSLVFKKGHRIRVHVTSSDFPHYDRNPNTGKEFGRDNEVRLAHQTVYHEAAYPSHIVLPVIPVSR
jgi:putative CocE/NonD family hydrolase